MGSKRTPDRGLTHFNAIQTWNPVSGEPEDERLDTNVGWAAFTSQGKILAVSEGPPNEPGPATIGTLDPSNLQTGGVD